MSAAFDAWVERQKHSGFLCHAIGMGDVAEAWKAAIAAEREACAVLVEDEGPCRHVDHVQGFCACAEKAAMIRARGKEPA